MLNEPKSDTNDHWNILLNEHSDLIFKMIITLNKREQNRMHPDRVI